MSRDLFSFTPFDFNGMRGAILVDANKEQEAALKAGQLQHQMFSAEELELGEISSSELGSAYRENNVGNKEFNFFNHQNPMMLQQQQQKNPSDMILNGFQPSFFFPPAQSFHEIPKLKDIQSSSQELVKPAEETPSPIALSSLELLSNYANGFKKLKRKQSNHPTNDDTNEGCRQKLSTEEIMRVAGARYIHFSAQSFDDFSMVTHPFGYALSGLSEEETRDVELVHLLLAAAEKVGYQQYERASRLLSRCDWTAAERANSLQRVVYYFAEALRGRIDKETGRIAAQEFASGTALTDHGLSYSVTSLKCYQKLPFNQVLYYAAIQTINENVRNANKIHVIDFEIRSGVQWTTFMLVLAEREQPVQLLKITAVGLQIQENVLEEVGKKLSSFAESLNIPFSFNIVRVSCFLDIKHELFRTRNDESLVVYCAMILRMMLSRSKCLENLLSVIKNLNPLFMVVCEIEANHNSPSFVNRFTEALFFYGAFFDSLETCLDQDIETRTAAEEVLNKGIQNVVAMEGTDRITRNVKIDVWRAFFTRFRMVEMGFSGCCLYQANQLLNRFPWASCCNLDMNGKSLITGWKGTPILSLSVWKFPRERRRLLN
uniref:DELLA protein RGL2 n=1 Tax=Dimocarpus longan TaxID=128017 RepID=A0A2U7PM58_9ROSI|nr:DELLA protein RGL2 [Dimocarpus longan]